MDDGTRQRLERWWNSWERGTSSESIVLYMTLGLRVGGPPLDGGDFGRCARLLEQFPEWKPRMGEMAVNEAWREVAGRWNEIAASPEPGKLLSLLHWPYEGTGFYSAVHVAGAQLREGAKLPARPALPISLVRKVLKYDGK